MNDNNYCKTKRLAKHTFCQNVSAMLSNFVWKLRDNMADHMSGLGNALLVFGPFATLFVGEYVYADRGCWAVGSEVVMPLIFVIAGFALKSYARVSRVDLSNIPVPYDRFTNVDYDSGQVDVDYNRIREMILYMADLEDWFDRNGYHE